MQRCAHALAFGRGEEPERVKINHMLEFQDLADAFNTMAKEVQAREMDLRESEKRERERAAELATLLESVPTPVFIVHDPHSLHITGNRAADDLLRIPRGSEVSLSAPPEVRPGHFRAIKDGRELRLDELPAQRAARGEDVENFEFSLVFDDGTTRHMLGYGTPLQDDEGRPRGAVHVLVDITARKQAEEALQTTLQRLHALFAGMQSSLLLVGEGRIEMANQAFCDYFGLEDTPEDLIGLTPRQLIDKIKNAYLHPDEQVNRIWEIARQRQPVIGEEIPMRDGRTSLRDFIPIYVDGKSYGLLWHHMDITGLKKAELALAERTAKLEEINKELESFSYSISHDLRTPLRAIDGYVRMLLKKHGHEFDEDSTRKFNVIRSNAQMMGHLIEDILTLSRVGRTKMSIVNLEMEEIIQGVWKELETINPERNMTLTIQTMPSAYGDRTLIRQVYANLLANAVKFTKYKYPAEIEAGSYTAGDDNVYYVKDNGVGFDMAYYDKLFGIFQRLHNNPDFEGTGVGLAIIQRVIHMHGGKVWAEGKVDEGATFYFSLPLSLTLIR